MTPDHEQTSIFGKVIAIFSHQFVIDSGYGTYLADIGPGDVNLVGLRQGDKVLIKGESQPFGIKVTEIVMGPGRPIRIEHHRT